MDFGKIFSRALKYPLNVQAFILLFLVNLASSYSSFNLIALTSPTEILSIASFSISLVPLAVSIIVTIFLMGLYIDNAAKYFSGSRKSLSKSIAIAKKKFFRLLGVQVLLMLILLLFTVPVLASIAIGAALGSLAAAIGNVISMAAMFIVVFFIFLAPYIAVLENYGVLGSIKASVNVVRKNKLNMLAFWIVYMLISIGAGLLSLPVTLGSISLLEQLNVAIMVLQSLISTYTALFAYSAFTNFYLNAKKK